MKRIFVFLLCLLTLFAVGCKESGNTPFDNNEGNTNTTQLDTFKEDGLNQIVGRKIDNIYLADGKIYYTFVNNTDKKSTITPGSVAVEKWENEQWIYYPLLSGVDRETYTSLAANSQHQDSRFIQKKTVTPGKYRLVSGYGAVYTNKDGNTYLLRKADYVYWAGYFTITEEQAAALTPSAELYFAAGVMQHQSVSLSISNIEHHLYLYEFSIQNTGDKNLIIPFSDLHPLDPDYFDQMMVYDKENDYFDHSSWWQRFPEGKNTVPPGETFRLPLCSNVGGDAADRYIPADGRYLYRLPCYFEGEEENFFYAVIFFEVKDGKIT